MNRLLEACALRPTDRTPVWFMRQAGRVLPEYRAVRARHDLPAIVRQPELCAEVTLQPVRRLGVDAAILFADIMTPLMAIGLDIRILEGAGPVLAEPVRTLDDARRLRALEPERDVPFVMETIRLLRAELPAEVALIGFAGAPFTLASYLVEGKASRTFEHTKRLMYGESDVWCELMDRLARLTAAYLQAQIDAGAQVVQLFDSWAGCLSPDDYRQYVQPYSRRIFKALRGAPTIHFGVDTGWLLADMAAAGGDVIGLDWRVPLEAGWAAIGEHRGVQGNLDPLTLLGPWSAIETATRRILDQAAGRPGHIFNLGHGLHPETSPETLKRLVELVHRV
jgi:uroporphyrinogen decarboxylase